MTWTWLAAPTIVTQQTADPADQLTTIQQHQLDRLVDVWRERLNNSTTSWNGTFGFANNITYNPDTSTVVIDWHTAEYARLCAVEAEDGNIGELVTAGPVTMIAHAHSLDGWLATRRSQHVAGSAGCWQGAAVEGIEVAELETGLQPTAAAARALREELGIDINPDHCTFHGIQVTRHPYLRISLYVTCELDMGIAAVRQHSMSAHDSWETDRIDTIDTIGTGGVTVANMLWPHQLPS